MAVEPRGPSTRNLPAILSNPSGADREMGGSRPVLRHRNTDRIFLQALPGPAAASQAARALLGRARLRGWGSGCALTRAGGSVFCAETGARCVRGVAPCARPKRAAGDRVRRAPQTVGDDMTSTRIDAEVTEAQGWSSDLAPQTGASSQNRKAGKKRSQHPPAEHPLEHHETS